MQQRADISSTIITKGEKMKTNWKRLVWVIFVILYAGLFFFNCLKPFRNWFVPYIYTMVLVVWLAYEYYRKNLFFQSGLIPDTLYFWLPRALFALFFYSSFVIGIATIIWWPKNGIGLYPFINAIGIAALAASIYSRQKTFRSKSSGQKAIRGFYFSLLLLIASLPFGYGSLFLIAYVIIIGAPLIHWNYHHERKVLASFSEYLKKQGADPAKRTDYTKYWEKYLSTIGKKKKTT